MNGKMNDIAIQLKQQIIHYKSEAEKYKYQFKKAEKLLQNEQQKYQSLLKSKQIIIEKTETERSEVTPYFSYSFMLPDKDDINEKVLVFGNFIIKNTGTELLTKPIICMRFSPVNSATLSGKIRLPHRKASENFLIESDEEWEYIHRDYKEKIKENGEYWLAPSHIAELPPGETMSLTNFEIEAQPSKKTEPFIAEGFVYFEQITAGVQSLNKIIVNW